MAISFPSVGGPTFGYPDVTLQNLNPQHLVRADGDASLLDCAAEADEV